MWRKKRWLVPLVFLTLIIATMIVLWFMRFGIADNFIQDQLAKNDVRARYELTELGFGRQRLQNLVLGDPKNPDLTAKEVIVTTRVGFFGVDVTSVSAKGVRLFGAIKDGRLVLGELDKLMPAPTGEPFTLPDINLAITDGRMRLASPVGVLGMRLDGRGNLANGFRGKLAAALPSVSYQGCRIERASAYVDLATQSRQPSIKGPLRLAALDCASSGIAARQVNVALDMNVGSKLDSFGGDARFDAVGAEQGDSRAQALLGLLSIEASTKGASGHFELSADNAIASGQALGLPKIKGQYDLAFNDEGVSGEVEGDFAVGHFSVGPKLLATLDNLSAGSGGTPIKALAGRLATATRAAAAGINANGSYAVMLDPSGGEARIMTLDAASRSGAKLNFVGDRGLSVAWPQGRGFGLSGTLTLAGGGMPEGHIVLTQSSIGGPMSGIARFQPFAAGDSRLALAPIRFSSDSVGNTRFDSRITLTGPVAGGRLVNASLPVEGGFSRDGMVVINRGCKPLTFDELSLSGVRFSQQALTLCPDEGDALYRRFANGSFRGGVRAQQPRLNGMTGQNPLTIAADDFSVGIMKGVFGSQNLKIRLGRGQDPIRLDVARLTGDFKGGGLRGDLSGFTGKITNVPLLVSQGNGAWQLKGGTLSLNAALKVDDEQREPTPRFMTLDAKDFALTFSGSRIDATSTLTDPESGRSISGVTITHNLNSGAGQADLNMARLVFDSVLEPSRLTPLAKGVVAEVRGAVSGRGQIRWNSQSVTSDGTFSTAGMDLAAPFGPVRGASGTIRFTDLLALKSAPGQVIELKEVNPGIAVFDGKLRYQLLPGPIIQIEGGEWPFAGGELALQPTALEFGEGKSQIFRFRVSGFDAAAFFQQYEFENLNVTGTFDGDLPIVFEDGTGYIRGGRLEARAPGGNIAYVGVLSVEDLGYFGNVAFQALKSIDYQNLIVEMNGSLGGNMVTSFKFDGLGQGSGTTNNFITRELAKLPFQFNITINGPFQKLISMGQSYYDPTLLVEQNLPALQKKQSSERGDVPLPSPSAPEDQVPSNPPPEPTPKPDATLPPTQPSVQPSESEDNL